ncbi:hypothetical protein GNP81_04090 [Aliivibrio fischeri]|uniref:DUF4136 domain-containing protein n=1 Tax=Aliivibrio fischeri TaxID=668 RepID=UPI0012D8DF3B|nr:DUF4136 domain-containing protein [Aliivibrio fischeri]MUK61104.1 hypothetical protein [Aliivibrio fischeri]MUK68590.1 hypothetical protein [Aliivibrio fischeri]MUK73110.1 hypothetical protein [Aliivibrio fischeri]MUK76017.1 hypothetical protein [Aliivibrio fischeri]MUL20972.1 hypothetical protein [Aliivibrio fischeri]
MKYILSLLLLFTLSGCVTETHQEKSTVNLVTTGDINNIISGRTFFSWHPDVNANYLNKKLNKNDTEEKFILALKNELKQKGFIYTDDLQKADFYIGYGLGVDTKISDDQILNKTGLSAGIEPHGIDENNSDKASVFIAVYLPTQLSPQWTILAQGYTNSDKTGAMDELLQLMFHSLEERN